MAVHKRLTTPTIPPAPCSRASRAAGARKRASATSRRRARHDARHQCGDRAPRRGNRHAGHTAGFSDILDMGFERRYDCSTCASSYSPPLVPRRLRLEVSERMRFDGSVERRSTRRRCGALPRARRRARSRRRSRSASCIPTPTRRTSGVPARSCARQHPILFVSASADVSQHARVRALDHDDRQRLHAADVRPLSRRLWRTGWPSRASAAVSTSCRRAAAYADRRHRAALPGARCWSRARPPAR